MEKILLTPGPCMTSAEVRQAASFPDLNHRDPRYLDLVHEIKSRLMGLYPEIQNGWIPYLLGGSGTLAVEAMITSCIPHSEKPVLVLENGYYSQRIRDIFEVHRIPYRSLYHDWLNPWDFNRIESELETGPIAVIGTHNETTLGRLNDIGRLGNLCRQYKVSCLIDAMSSFCADPVPFEGIDALCSSANKCIHGIPGVSFVLVREEYSRNVMSSITGRSYYMHLPRYEGDNPPLTPPIPAMQAFCQALREVPEGEAIARGKNYEVKADLIRRSLSALGLSFAIPIEESSCTLTSVTIPKGFTWSEWFELNYEAGYVLYGCKEGLRDQFFQVSNMGEVSVDAIASWLEFVKQSIK